MTIWFDMDGTIADLYGVASWLDMLRNYKDTPYRQARPLINMNYFAKLLTKKQAEGLQIGIISWLSKESNPLYDAQVTRAKQYWLKKHLKSVKWNKIIIVPYGTPKSNYARENDILFDDEEKNRIEWGSRAYAPEMIFPILKTC